MKNNILKKREFIALFFLLIGFALIAQQITFLNSEGGNPVAFCEMLVDDEVIFSDELGILNRNKKSLIIVTDFRFKSLQFKSPVNDTIIKLTSEIIDLQLIVISNIEYSVESKKLKSNFTSIPYGLELGFWCELEEYGGQLKGINFDLQARKNSKAFLKVDFFDDELERLNPGNIIIPIDQLIKQNGKISIEHQRIFVGENKLFISLRIIDEINYKDQNNLEINKIKFLNSKKKDSVYFRNNSKSKWKPLSESLNVPWVKLVFFK